MQKSAILICTLKYNREIFSNVQLRYLLSVLEVGFLFFTLEIFGFIALMTQAFILKEKFKFSVIESFYCQCFFYCLGSLGVSLAISMLRIPT